MCVKLGLNRLISCFLVYPVCHSSVTSCNCFLNSWARFKKGFIVCCITSRAGFYLPLYLARFIILSSLSLGVQLVEGNRGGKNKTIEVVSTGPVWHSNSRVVQDLILQQTLFLDIWQQFSVHDDPQACLICKFSCYLLSWKLIQIWNSGWHVNDLMAHIVLISNEW